MDKRQGFALGAILAAGLFLRPAGSLITQQGGSSKDDTTSTTLSSLANAEGEGPWIASCNYWAPMREPAWRNDAAKVQSAIDAEGNGVGLHLRLHGTSKEAALGCPNQQGKRWGFPDNGDRLGVTAIVATVPDPVHAHLAMIFDRTIDALLQAAQDNGYVASYFWLPWKNHGASGAADGDGGGEPGHDAVREREPGLIVLRHVPNLPNAKFDPQGSYDPNPQGSYNKVIYIFLVAETPTLGIDGFQFQRAFAYEDELASALLGRGSFSRGRDGATAIIGPQYSGSAASLRAAIGALMRTSGPTDFEVAGITWTELPANLLTSEGTVDEPRIRYRSFDNSREYVNKVLAERLRAASYDPQQTTLLIEDDTTLGVTSASPGGYQFIRFPRDISLVRNAQAGDDQYGAETPSSTGFRGPYLPFSLRDPGPEHEDSVPDFSRQHTPLSKEAQLMAIARELHRYRSKFIGIVASNVLDQVFLAQFLHRACPDARLLFFGSDLLMVREVDNVPFIGAVTITPYPLLGLGEAVARRTYPGSSDEAYYNAAAYTLWDRDPSNPSATTPNGPHLYGYQSPLGPPQPSIWATAIGSDGYYPLGVLSPCASDDIRILPLVGETQNGSSLAGACAKEPELPSRLPTRTIYPSRLWSVLWSLVSILCLLHSGTLIVAEYWSPLTRDLAIHDNDQPVRRAMGIHVATAMLFSMAFTVSFPVLSLNHIVKVSGTSVFESWLTIAFGLAAVFAAFWRTWKYLGWPKPSAPPSGHREDVHERVSFLLTVAAWVALVTVAGVWWHLCLEQSVIGKTAASSVYFVGASFAYRCINPSSGVSPVIPVLLLLFAWYIWAFFQTRRLRFSENGRPQLPKRLPEAAGGRLFISDDDLSNGDFKACESPRCCYLYENITCLLLMRQLLRRFWSSRKTLTGEPGHSLSGQHAYPGIDAILFLCFAGVLVWFSFFSPIRSLDHFVWNSGAYRSNPYEFLIGVLFCPLIVVCLAGWLRMVLIWAALKGGVLERLEDLPIRFAFNRLKVMGWLTMFSQAGLREQWRDMARSRESMRQMLHPEGDLNRSMSDSEWCELKNLNTDLAKEIKRLISRSPRPPCPSHAPKPAEPPVSEVPPVVAAETVNPLPALPKGPPRHAQDKRHDYDSMREIELRFAEFSQALLKSVLIPHWENARTGLVEGDDVEELPIKARRAELETEQPHIPMEMLAGRSSSEPAYILAAEEFVAIRYMSLIRSVLANLRYLMIFVSVSFVLSIMAWNSYPFEPRQQVDWLFTGLLVLLGSGMIWVFAQMHRDPILSRLTNTKANELGWDFYFRVVSFGALPVLTWLAYQFPDFGNVISKFIQPTVPIIK